MKETAYLEIEGIQVALYDTQTSGTPVIFLHGNSASTKTFSAQFDSPILKDFRLLAIDLPGHGLSPKPADPEGIYQTPVLLLLYAELIKRLNLENVVLVGNSFGGHLAIELLNKTPKIAGIFIFGTPALGKPARIQEAFMADTAIGFFYKPEALTEEEIEVLIQKTLFQPAAVQATETVKEAFRTTDFQFRGALAQIVASENYDDEEEILKHTTVPVAVVHGEKEILVSLPYLQNLHIFNLWQGKVHIIPNAGHYPQLEQPEAFNQLLVRFIRELVP